MVYNADGTFKKFKARLVARGDMLKNIFDPDTYAGTVRADSIRLLLSIAAEHDLDLVSHDIKTAFLYSDLKPEENIFLRRPTGVSDNIMPYIVQLKKCLYGLPQASKYFDEHLSSRLLAMGFQRCISDAEMFVLSRAGEKVILSKHVDDCLLAGTKGSTLLAYVESELKKTYQLTTTIEPHNFVGLAISRDRANRSITISQPHFVNKIIDLYSIPTSTAKYPMAEDFLTSLRCADPSATPLLAPELQTLFQEKVGNILYLSSQTRPDILYATTQLSRRSNKTTARDMAAADRLLRYIASTADMGLTFCTHGESANIYAYVDASYDCYSDSKSHTGISLHLGKFSGAFMTFSKKQTITADSTTVAEFVGTHTACQKVLWAQNLLNELGYSQYVPATMFQDNQSTIRLILHKGNAGRTKHIALRYNMIRECVKHNNISIVYLPTDQMVADTLTKPLGALLFPQHQARILNLYSPN